MVLEVTFERHLTWEYVPKVPLQYFLMRMPFLLLSAGSHTFLITSKSSVKVVAYIVPRITRELGLSEIVTVMFGDSD